MKGVILAGLAMIFLVTACAIGLRVYRGDKEYKVFLGSLGAALIAYSVLFKVLPDTLGFLPQALVEPFRAVDFWNGILVLATVFHGFWVFTYVACLGPSMNLVVEISARGPRGLTLDESLALFGRDAPVNKILRRRLPKLIRGGYVTEDAGRYRLLPRGRIAGRICLYARRAIGDVREEGAPRCSRV